MFKTLQHYTQAIRATNKPLDTEDEGKVSEIEDKLLNNKPVSYKDGAELLWIYLGVK